MAGPSRSDTMVALLGVAAQLPAVRTRTDPTEAADAALAAARVWYTELESRKPSPRSSKRGQPSQTKAGPSKSK